MSSMRYFIVVTILSLSTASFPLNNKGSSEFEKIFKLVNPKEEIVHPDVKHDLNYQVALHNGTRDYCGGTIIDDWYVLTAARCVVNRGKPIPGPIYVLVKSNIAENSKAIHRVDSFYVPKVFQAKSEAIETADLAVLKLDSPLNLTNSDYLRKVNVPQNPDISKVDAYNGQIATISGYTAYKLDEVYNKNQMVSSFANRKKYWKKIYPDKLSATVATIVPHDECKNEWKDVYEYIQMDHLCAITKGITRSGICTGDTGNGLILNNTVIGIFSRADIHRCYDSVVGRQRGRPGVYTSVNYWAHFINSILNNKPQWDQMKIYYFLAPTHEHIANLMNNLKNPDNVKISNMTIAMNVTLIIDDFEMKQCVGSLIDHEYVVMPANCVLDENGSEYHRATSMLVHFFTNNLEIINITIPAHSVWVPKFKNTCFEQQSKPEDIAVIKLEYSFDALTDTFMQPLLFPHDYFNNSINAMNRQNMSRTIPGYGIFEIDFKFNNETNETTVEKLLYPDTLLVDKDKTLEPDECLMYYHMISPMVFCRKVLNSTLYNDFCEINSNNGTAYGSAMIDLVYSGKLRCYDSYYYSRVKGVYGKMSQYLKFIKESMDDVEGGCKYYPNLWPQCCFFVIMPIAMFVLYYIVRFCFMLRNLYLITVEIDKPVFV